MYMDASLPCKIQIPPQKRKMLSKKTKDTDTQTPPPPPHTHTHNLKENKQSPIIELQPSLLLLLQS